MSVLVAVLLVQTDDAVLEDLARRQARSGGWGLPKSGRDPDDATRANVRTQIAALEGPDIEGREAAVTKLAAIGPPAVPQLKRAMETDDAELRARCVDALEQIDSDAEATSGALLEFLSRGWTHLQVKYKETVKRGLQWLHRRQEGSGGLSGDARTHCIAMLALVEAYRLTGSQVLKPACDKALARARSLAPESPADIAWQVTVLRAAERARLGDVKEALDAIESRLETKKGTAAHAARILIADRDARIVGRHRLEAIYRTRPPDLSDDELLFARMAVGVGEGWPPNSREWLERADAELEKRKGRIPKVTPP